MVLDCLENVAGIVVFRVFQHDLYQLRLNTARSVVAALETSASPVSSDPGEPLKLTVQVYADFDKTCSLFA